MRVKRLPESLVRKIAAGEVVHNPSFVVKELVENSLDAGATTVAVELEAGGKNLVRVQDDGIGMTREDVLLAIQLHTTSKIEKEEDLFRITTYGFRGEALSSIAQVSRLEIVTKAEEDPIATRVVVVAGEVMEVTNAFRDRGTTVTVRDLFFNIPVKRKTLKSTTIEYRMSKEMFERFAMVRSDVNFSLVHDGKLVWNFLKTSDPFERPLILLEDLRRGFITFDEEVSGVRVKGIVSSRDVTRADRTGQYFYVNGRFVLCEELSEVLNKVYDLPKRRFPIAVIFLELDPSEVDVNVHPSKLTVKFSNEGRVLGVVEEVLRKNLAKKWYKAVVYEEISERVRMVAEGESKRWFIVKGKYALIEEEDGLMFVDLHALHERVIYEEMLSKRVWPTKEVNWKVSKMKEELELTGKELKELGFSFEMLGETVVFKKVPEFLSQDELVGFLKEMVGGKVSTLKEKLALAACKLAKKSGEFDEDLTERLLTEFFRKRYTSCPHGRPISFKMNYQEIDKIFERG